MKIQHRIIKGIRGRSSAFLRRLGVGKKEDLKLVFATSIKQAGMKVQSDDPGWKMVLDSLKQLTAGGLDIDGVDWGTIPLFGESDQ